MDVILLSNVSIFSSCYSPKNTLHDIFSSRKELSPKSRLTRSCNVSLAPLNQEHFHMISLSFTKLRMLMSAAYAPTPFFSAARVSLCVCLTFPCDEMVVGHFLLEGCAGDGVSALALVSRVSARCPSVPHWWSFWLPSQGSAWFLHFIMMALHEKFPIGFSINCHSDLM